METYVQKKEKDVDQQIWNKTGGLDHHMLGFNFQSCEQ